MKYSSPTTLISLILCLRGIAASFYVSSSSGDDSNPGTSIDAPWKSLTNVYTHQWGFNPGDSLLLKAGETFGDPLSLGSGGTPGYPITIDRYGTGPNPIIYGDHPNASWSPVAGHSGIYSTYLGVPGYVNVGKVYDINGLRYYHLLQGSSTLDDYLNTFTNACWGANDSAGGNIIFVQTPDSNPPPQMRLFSAGTVGVMGGFHIIQNLEICNGGIGIIANGTHDIIRNNYVHDGYSSGIFLYHSSSCEVQSNTVTRTGDSQIYLQQGGSNWVHHNTCSYSGGSNGTWICGNVVIPNIENCGIGLETGTNNIIEYNSLSYLQGSFFDYFYEVSSDVRFNYGFHATMAAAPLGTGLRVHHNVLNLDGAGSGFSANHAYDPANSPAPDSGPNLIYNNVLYSLYGTAFYTRNPGASGVVFLNNIVLGTMSMFSLADVATGTACDYNAYFCTGSTSIGWVLNDVALYQTIADWRSASGLDLHSFYSDPQIVSIAPVSAVDFKLKSTSPCIDSGTNLNFSGQQDYLGGAIPQGFGSDIGAFEYPGSVSNPPPLPPAPPTNLHIISGYSTSATLGLSYDFSGNPGVTNLVFLRGGTSGVYTQQLSTGLSTSVNETGLQKKRTYYFSSKAQGNNGESVYSNEVQYTTPAH